MKAEILNLLKSLPKCTSEVLEYIEKNYDAYKDELESAYDSFGFVLDDVQNAIDQENRYIEELSKHTLKLDINTQTMKFDEKEYPAYWYKKGMSRETINANLEVYRRIFHENPETEYPLLETYYSLSEWENWIRLHHYAKDPESMLKKMEKDLESGEGDDAITLQYELDMGASISRIFDVYPRKLKRIVKVIEKHGEKDLKFATLVLKTREGRQCTVEITFTEDGSFRGIRALGKNGFPMFVEDDFAQIWREVFFK